VHLENKSIKACLCFGYDLLYVRLRLPLKQHIYRSLHFESEFIISYRIVAPTAPGLLVAVMINNDITKNLFSFTHQWLVSLHKFTIAIVTSLYGTSVLIETQSFRAVVSLFFVSEQQLS
jgi:hypothetical protein